MLKIVKCRKPSPRLIRLFCSSALLTTFIVSSCYAEPWANAGDERTRFHVQVLSDAGKINHPVSSWPMMWVDIEASLSGIDIKQLTDRELWSYRYLKHVIDRARRRVSGVKTGHFANSRSAINDFASASRERAELSSSITANIDRFSFKIRATTFENIEDDRILRFDGSYAAGTWGNWVLGFGAIDRWWGPGWQSSLVLSNNARPTEGFFMQRKQSEAFSLPGLSLLGPWNIHLFSNQLESRRDIANAKLSGARFTFKPANFLDIGLSRVVQWGGRRAPRGLANLNRLSAWQ